MMHGGGERLPHDRAFGRIVDYREGYPELSDDPLLNGRPLADLAQIDRYAQGNARGAEIPGGKIGGALLAGPVALAGGAIAGANELDKGLTGGRIANLVTGEDQFLTDETSSPASIENVKAFVQGILDGAMHRFGDEGGDDGAPPPETAESAVPFARLQLPGEQEVPERGNPEAGAGAYKAWLLKRMGSK